MVLFVLIFYNTPLHTAAIDAVKALIEEGVNINAKDNIIISITDDVLFCSARCLNRLILKCTPLLLSCASKSYEIAHLLVDNCADINMSNNICQSVNQHLLIEFVLNLFYGALLRTFLRNSASYFLPI